MARLKPLNPGDVYVGKMPDGRFGAAKVLRFMVDGGGRGKDSVLVSATPYMGDSPPLLSDPTLRVIHQDSRCTGAASVIRFSVCWIDKAPPAIFTLLGNIPLSVEEKPFDPKGAYGQTWESMLKRVFWEWRWNHDREAFERELREEKEARLKVAQTTPGPRKPIRKSTLKPKDFWSLIGRLRWEETEPESILAPLVEDLSGLSAPNILEFEELLAETLYSLDGKAWADHAGNAGKSDDAFLYARCYLVARGETFYRKVLGSPDQFPAEANFELLLTAAEQAYEKRTGESLEHSTHFSYETGSNLAGWPPEKAP